MYYNIFSCVLWSDSDFIYTSLRVYIAYTTISLYSCCNLSWLLCSILLLSNDNLDKRGYIFLFCVYSENTVFSSAVHCSSSIIAITTQTQIWLHNFCTWCYNIKNIILSLVLTIKNIEQGFCQKNHTLITDNWTDVLTEEALTGTFTHTQMTS